MSFQTRTAIPGELETASDYNTYVRDPLNALRGGSIAIASQTAKDLILAADATSFTRLAAVAGAFPRLTPAGVWAMALQSYAPTLLNALNSAAKTAILTASIPANDLSDGTVLLITISALVKNNKGSPGTVTFGVSYAGSEVSPVDGAISYANVATEYKLLWRFMLMRVGADVWVFTHSATAGGGSPSSLPDLITGFDPGTLAAGGVTPNVRAILAPDFTTAQNLLVNITLSAADANFYVKPQSANVRRQSL